MSDDEQLGAITAPMTVRPSVPRGSPRSLARHPMTDDEMLEPCGCCGHLGFGYEHPNPLRPGVILWRCWRHRHPKHAVDDPKAAPGGGVYR